MELVTPKLNNKTYVIDDSIVKEKYHFKLSLPILNATHKVIRSYHIYPVDLMHSGLRTQANYIHIEKVKDSSNSDLRTVVYELTVYEEILGTIKNFRITHTVSSEVIKYQRNSWFASLIWAFIRHLELSEISGRKDFIKNLELVRDIVNANTSIGTDFDHIYVNLLRLSNNLKGV